MTIKYAELWTYRQISRIYDCWSNIILQIYTIKDSLILLMPDVSIIVPIYNTVEEMLKKCIESLTSQSYSNIEIILIDDGSDNDALSICHSYASMDSRVKVIHQINQGVSVARNAGIDISQSKYLTFVDADDWVDVDMIQDLMDLVFKYSPDVVLWEYALEKRNSTRISKKPALLNTDVCHVDQNEIITYQRAMIGGDVRVGDGVRGGPVCKIYKKKILDDHRIRFKSNLIRSQDNEMNFRYFEYVNNAIYIKRKYYHYRIHSNSATHEYNENADRVMDIYLSEILKNIYIYNKGDVFFRDYNFIIVGKFADICRTQYAHPKSKLSIRENVRAIALLANSEIHFNAVRPGYTQH